MAEVIEYRTDFIEAHPIPGTNGHIQLDAVTIDYTDRTSITYSVTRIGDDRFSLSDAYADGLTYEVARWVASRWHRSALRLVAAHTAR